MLGCPCYPSGQPITLKHIPAAISAAQLPLPSADSSLPLPKSQCWSQRLPTAMLLHPQAGGSRGARCLFPRQSSPEAMKPQIPAPLCRLCHELKPALAHGFAFPRPPARASPAHADARGLPIPLFVITLLITFINCITASLSQAISNFKI